MTGRLQFRGGTLVTPTGLVATTLTCEGGRIVAIGEDPALPSAAAFNATGLVIGPGFADVHCHGGGGYTFFSRDPANVTSYSAWAPRHGVTSFLVSTAGRDAAAIEAVLASLAPHLDEAPGAEALGFHLEGPFINPLRRGAFEAASLRPPARDEFARWCAASRGRLRQVTIAPELPGALDIIRDAAAAGVVAAMGHTDATAGQAREGFAAGVRHVTHLFNAMRPLHQREGGPIAAALLEEAVTCELICDGVHIAPEVLRLAWRLLGSERAIVVTDNLAMAGTDTASGVFGGQPLSVQGAAAVKADGTIAGSVATMDQHFRNVIEFLGIGLPEAFRLCATNPARISGAASRKGTIEPGKDADLVLLDSANQVTATTCRGEVAFCSDPARLSRSP